MKLCEVEAELETVFRFVRRDCGRRCKNFNIVEFGEKDSCEFGDDFLEGIF